MDRQQDVIRRITAHVVAGMSVAASILILSGTALCIWLAIWWWTK